MTEWLSAPLTHEHDVSVFDCEVPSLNDWLKKLAVRAQDADTARTFVWTAPGSRVVTAYYSIAPTQILRESLTSGQAGGFSVVPAYLLARLALDHSLRGQGLGSQLLIDALQVIVMSSDRASGRLIVVDAIDDSAASFYRHHDFSPVKDNARRLVMKVSTARNALGMTRMQVTRSREAHLVSVVFELPDGKSVPVVLSETETRAFANKIQEAADLVPHKEISLNLREVFREILGRDPFDD